MSKTTILETIIEIIKEYGINIDVKSLDFNMPMKKIGIDSILGISIIVSLEKKLNIRIPDNLLTKITTINELIDVCEKLSNSN